MIPLAILGTALFFALGTTCNYYSIVVFKLSLTKCGGEVLGLFFCGILLLFFSGLSFYAWNRCIEILKNYKYYK